MVMKAHGVLIAACAAALVVVGLVVAWLWLGNRYGPETEKVRALRCRDIAQGRALVLVLDSLRASAACPRLAMREAALDHSAGQPERWVLRWDGDTCEYILEKYTCAMPPAWVSAELHYSSRERRWELRCEGSTYSMDYCGQQAAQEPAGAGDTQRCQP